MMMALISTPFVLLLLVQLCWITLFFTLIPESQGVKCIHCFTQGDEVAYVPPRPNNNTNNDTSPSPLFEEHDEITEPPTETPHTDTPTPTDTPTDTASIYNVPSCSDWDAAGKPANDPKYSKDCPSGCKTEIYKVIMQRFTPPKKGNFSSLQIYSRCRDDEPRDEGECLDFTDIAKPYWAAKEAKIQRIKKQRKRQEEQERKKKNVVALANSSTSTSDPISSMSTLAPALPKDDEMLWFVALVCGCNGTEGESSACNADLTPVLERLKDLELDWIEELEAKERGNGTEKSAKSGVGLSLSVSGSKMAVVVVILVVASLFANCKNEM